ncbi:MAG: proprotein convertase P-domain-containing protein [Proteobacteria bacterium]|nr:proprotein convertase P-domain-containing protein [Pseudomonadota bacterium]
MRLPHSCLLLLVGFLSLTWGAVAQAQVKPRFFIGFDTSGSMRWALDGTETSGDGVGKPDGMGGIEYFDCAETTAGQDLDCDGLPNDSRMWIAKEAIRSAVLAYGDVEWALGRFHQNQGDSASSRTYNGTTCGGIGCPSVNRSIHYDGVCSVPGNADDGGDVLVGFPDVAPFVGLDNTYSILKWMDNVETNFINSTTEAHYCDHQGAGDCELRAEGPTPLEGILWDARQYLTPIKNADSTASCRGYYVILLTDGEETCSGTPTIEAAALLAAGIKTYVVGLAISSGNLDAIAAAGGTGTAFFAGNQAQLSAALASIVSDSLLTEQCNGVDDDCDGLIDEGFTLYCNRPAGTPSQVLCSEPAESLCDGIDDDCDGLIDEGLLDACGQCPGQPEVCDGLDNNCNGQVDEGGVCNCFGEICDNIDNDCDGNIDEGVTRSCGHNVGICSVGQEICNAGVWGSCSGQQPQTETCDGLDNNCDGISDGITRPCGSGTGECVSGVETCAGGTWGACIGRVGPKSEICDNIDNDCDGKIDEGVANTDPRIGQSCGSSVGACTAGTTACSNGSVVCNGGGSGSGELCNRIDDDCDGSIDEGNPGGGGPCGSSVGICQPGSLLCVSGTHVCQGEVAPSPEVCDGKDNNCDGQVDEGNPGGGNPCGTDIGECTLGSTACISGTLQCQGGTGPGSEVCDRRDNDCDGMIDEANPGGGAPCGPTTDTGHCKYGAEACVDGAIVCIGAVLPSAEICDRRDNDCDGVIDEGVAASDPRLGQPCGDGTGECTKGVTACVDGASICQSGQGPTPELCDGKDNNCNGVVDEGIPVGAPCGSDRGECQPGLQICDSATGMTICQGAIGPTDEICDVLDNDCDGKIDEGLGRGEPCGTNMGECAAGVQRCVKGQILCVGEMPPTGEICDCRDNDCDGKIDEHATGSLCPEDAACVMCQCALPCRQLSEFGSCPTGKVPVTDNGSCYCVGKRCDQIACSSQTIETSGETRCAPDEPRLGACVCKNNECTFPCEGVVCAMGTVCDPRDGACKEPKCTVLGCDAEKRCNAQTGKCEDDPCAIANCAPDQACRDGICFASCAGVACNDTQRCVEGQCVSDPCAGVTCPAGEVCNPTDSSCIPRPCPPAPPCPGGFVCHPVTGQCEPDPCEATTCPAGQICDRGECTDPPAPPQPQNPVAVDPQPPAALDGTLVVATGAGGCTCSVAPGRAEPDRRGLWVALLFGLAAVLSRRLRSRILPATGATTAALRRWLLLSLLGTALAFSNGCKVDPLCLDCVEPDAPETGPRPDGSTRVGSGGGAGSNTTLPQLDGGGDAGAGWDGGCATAETCDGKDNDCDGLIDEGFDLTTSAEHCGACNQACAPDHAYGNCMAGACQFAGCDVGFFNLDGNQANGCEYRCVKTHEDDSLCDLRDNDCDGQVDENVNLQLDPLNCGSCGFTCRFAHANLGASCVAGECTLDATKCDPGFHDVDGRQDNGCEYSCIASTTASEQCNAVDDDCDGRLDEGVETSDSRVSQPCGTPVGTCMAGTTVCSGGAIQCMGEVGASTETCDGLDNDCDGKVDESDARAGFPCGIATGTCRRGVLQCNSTTTELECVGAVGPVAERCDGLDNDCDNELDEGNPGGAQPCGQSDSGQCSFGLTQCVGGVVQCLGEVGPSPETCDGMDNDCDGQLDEADPNLGASCSSDVGECSSGQQSCQGGALACLGATGPSAEACDGKDNDCDGSFDEGNPGGGAVCGGSMGECSPGTETCIGGTLQCTGAGGPRPEVCDGLDNDCDGVADNGFQLQTDLTNCGSCGNVCQFDNAFAICSAGSCALLVCRSGFVDANGDPADGCELACSVTGPETCDGIDNDCDNRLDEDVQAPPGYCNTQGVCAGVTPACQGGSLVCANLPAGPEYQPGGETLCDSLDNDCDGQSDEGYPVAQSCSNGQGVCERTGSFLCNSTQDGVVCNAAAAGTPGSEQCNGLDDDCDGQIDELDDPSTPASDEGIGIGDVDAVDIGGGVLMMSYEASRPDASASDPGTMTALACSRGNVLPWTNVTWQQARDACCALNFGGSCSQPGWRLCARGEWERGCQGAAGGCTWAYGIACNTPNGTSSAAQLCNGQEYDCIAATPEDEDCVAATGSFNQCHADWGSAGRVYDLSGNLKEWTETEVSPGVHEIRGGSFNNVESGRRCAFDFSVGDMAFRFPNTGFRCCYGPNPPAPVVLAAPGLPITMAGSQGVIASTLDVSVVGSIADVNVLDVTGSITRFSDLRISLTSPNGTEVILVDYDTCGADDNWDFSMDDEAAATLSCGQPVGGSGSFVPLEPLSAFDGQNSAGTWTLRVMDDRAGRTPTLAGWSLGLSFQ